ncbi:MAG: flippase [Chloroflexi bacterium]|nr:flippase [Chloroflexota bacterium]
MTSSIADGEKLVASPQPVATFEQNILQTAKGGSYLFFGKLFTFASRFIVTLLLTRFLGPADYGLYTVALSAAGLASGFALVGLDTTLVRYVALYASRRDEQRLWGSIQLGLGISMVLSAVWSALLFGFAHWIAVNVFHDVRLAPVLQLVSFIVPVLGLSNLLAGATRGFKHMEDMVIAQNFAQPLVRVVLIVALAFAGLNIFEAIIIYGLADLTASIVLLYFLNKRFSLRRSLSSARHEPRAILSYSIPMWLSELITTFRGSIQTILLGSLNTVFTVGIFSVANQINLFADLVQTSMTMAVRPIIVEVHDMRNREQLRRLYQTVSKWLFAFNFPVFLVVILFPTEILSVFGKSFEQGASALVLLSWASLVDAGTGMCGAILDMTGYTKLKLTNSILRLGTVLVMSIWLIPTQGMVGAAYAALSGEIVVNFSRLAQVYVLFQILPYSISFLKPVFAGLIALGVMLLMRYWIGFGSNGLEVVFQMGFLVLMYISLVLIFGLDQADRTILNRMKRRTSRKLGRESKNPKVLKP